jgi:hypothetical protein
MMACSAVVNGWPWRYFAIAEDTVVGLSPASTSFAAIHVPHAAFVVGVVGAGVFVVTAVPFPVTPLAPSYMLVIALGSVATVAGAAFRFRYQL